MGKEWQGSLSTKSGKVDQVGLKRCSDRGRIKSDKDDFENKCSVGSKGKGKQTIIGGTGRFKGITGVCNYTVKYLPENKLTTVGTCDYKI